MQVNTCAFVVGDLLEIRAAAGYRAVDDVSAMMSMIAATVGQKPPARTFSIAADWRGVHVMAPDTAARRCSESGTVP